MLYVRNQIMLLLVVYTPVIFGISVSSYGNLRRIQDTDDPDIHNARIGMEDPCASFDCHNNGSCYLFQKNPKCVCQPEYFGLHCEKKTDGTSTATQPVEIEITTENSKNDVTEDPCASIHCQNGGSCLLFGKNPVCVCQLGYSGPHCEENMEDPCASFDCHNNGSCYLFEKNPKCVCQAEYVGLHCDEKMDLCISMPCQNEGICLQEGSSFICYCKHPYLGAFCEKDPCTGNPCQNGGICVQTDYSFKYQCRYPYSGDTCQYDACYDNPCFNGGTCEKDGDYFKCKCRYGYYGSVCEKEGSESTPDTTIEFKITPIPTVEDQRNSTVENYTEPTHELTKFTLNFNLTTIKPGICAGDTDCLNGGICRNSYCDCQPNFGGYRCEKNFLCEKLKPTCRALGATCKIVGLNAICVCPQDKMYHPKTGMCEDICDPWKCIHGRCEIDGRTYKCICDSGYTGYKCSETVQPIVERSYVLFYVMTSLLMLICFLLIGQMCIFCRNRKFKLHSNDGILAECTSSRTTTSDA